MSAQLPLSSLWFRGNPKSRGGCRAADSRVSLRDVECGGVEVLNANNVPKAIRQSRLNRGNCSKLKTIHFAGKRSLGGCWQNKLGIVAGAVVSRRYLHLPGG